MEQDVSSSITRLQHVNVANARQLRTLRVNVHPPNPSRPQYWGQIGKLGIHSHGSCKIGQESWLL